HGANVNAKTDHDGRTPLHDAALGAHLEMVKLLVEHGADVNAKCDRNKGINPPPQPSNATPADWATENEYPDVLNYLLRKGGKLTKPTPPPSKPSSEPISLAESRHELQA